MTLHPVFTRPDVVGPLRCLRCGVFGHEDPTVYQRITITGEKQPPLCGHCSHKLDRVARMSRRGDCEA